MNKKILGVIAFCLVFVAAGITVFLFGNNDLKKIDSYPQTKAVITRIEGYYDGDDYEHDVYVRYTVDEIEHENKLNEYKSSFYEGKEITISYNPNDPTDILVASKTTPMILIGIGALFVAAGLVGLVVGIVKNKELN